MGIDREDVMDMICCGVIFVAVWFVIFLATSIVSKAGEPCFVTYEQADCNMTTYILKNAEAYNNAMDEFNRHLSCSKYQETIDDIEAKAKQQEEERAKKSMKEKLKKIFGYVPTWNEIMFQLRHVQAECGNTEPIEGIERVIEVGANRCRSSKFPNTLYEVYSQPGQYETHSNGRWQGNVNERVMQAWNNVLERGYCRDTNVLFFTAGGYNGYCRPGYVIHNHYFGY